MKRAEILKAMAAGTHLAYQISNKDQYIKRVRVLSVHRKAGSVWDTGRYPEDPNGSYFKVQRVMADGTDAGCTQLCVPAMQLTGTWAEVSERRAIQEEEMRKAVQAWAEVSKALEERKVTVAERVTNLFGSHVSTHGVVAHEMTIPIDVLEKLLDGYRPSA